jgi:hypothetical protein
MGNYGNYGNGNYYNSYYNSYTNSYYGNYYSQGNSYGNSYSSYSPPNGGNGPVTYSNIEKVDGNIYYNITNIYYTDHSQRASPRDQSFIHDITEHTGGPNMAVGLHAVGAAAIAIVASTLY